MALVGYYYLHDNGALIYKREIDGGTAADIRESPFARGLWPIDPADRSTAWRIVVEGLAAGADKGRVADLAGQWSCNDADAQNYAKHIGVVLERDGNAWFAHRHDFEDLQQSPAGFGDTALEAFAALANELGYKPSKMWGATFADLCRVAPVKSEPA